MTDTAKPTNDKGCTVKLWDRANLRYFLSDEAVDVYHETNLTPRQLLERVRELEVARDDAIAKAFRWMSIAGNTRINPDWYPDTEFNRWREEDRATLAKHGEDV